METLKELPGRHPAVEPIGRSRLENEGSSLVRSIMVKTLQAAESVQKDLGRVLRFFREMKGKNNDQ